MVILVFSHLLILEVTPYINVKNILICFLKKGQFNFRNYRRNSGENYMYFEQKKNNLSLNQRIFV
jgi:hypothetical protein